jgi:hypothetical protein
VLDAGRVEALVRRVGRLREERNVSELARCLVP